MCFWHTGWVGLLVPLPDTVGSRLESRGNSLISPFLTAWLEQEELLGVMRRAGEWIGKKKHERLQSGCNFV